MAIRTTLALALVLVEMFVLGTRAARSTLAGIHLQPAIVLVLVPSASNGTGTCTCTKYQALVMVLV